MTQKALKQTFRVDITLYETDVRVVKKALQAYMEGLESTMFRRTSWMNLWTRWNGDKDGDWFGARVEYTVINKPYKRHKSHDLHGVSQLRGQTKTCMRRILQVSPTATVRASQIDEVEVEVREVNGEFIEA